MQYRRYKDTYAVRLDIGEEIMESLFSLCEKESIRLAQVSAIGAADRAVIGVFSREKQSYAQETLDQFMEITSLSGNVTTMEGKPYIHLHTTLADQNHGIHGGHVLEMRTGLTCEMFLQVIDGEIGRERDEELGINLWKI